MNARESVLSDKARAIRELADYLERYPRDAERRFVELQLLVLDYSDMVRSAWNKYIENLGIDVCADQPDANWHHCEGCHSVLCQSTAHCYHEHSRLS